MNTGSADRSDDEQLRESIRKHALPASAGHNEAILAAARAKAARQRRLRMIERSRSWTGAGIAAAVLLAAGLWIAVPDTAVDDDRIRGDRAVAATVPADNARLGNVPSTFRWQHVPETRRYRVTVYDDNASPVWQSDWITVAEVAIAPNAAAAMPSGHRYFWRVELDGDGPRQSLGPYWFTIE